MKSIKVRQLPTTVIVGCCCSALMCAYTLRKLQNWKRKQELLSKIRLKQADRKQQFDRLREENQLQPELISITELNLEVLVENLQSRQLTAVQVLKAYLAKAVRVSDEFNCITEFIPWAEGLAQELDKLPEVKGPLHGVPVAIKDDHDVVEMDSTLGFAKNLYKPASKNSVPVQILIDLGAVPFCKTNVPQALASINSDNPVYGTTYNALDKTASPGGSSGGSGCVVAAGAAPVATGSDVAGSLRIPAHFHGMCAMRSTNGRLSCEGMHGNLKHVITINAVSGFITKNAASQVTMYKLVTEGRLQNKYDPTVVPLPWNETLFQSKPLKIGYYTSLPIFPAFGDTPGTVLRAKQALESLNYQLVEFSLPDSFDLSRSVFGLYWCDLGKNLLREFDGEPLSKSGTGLVGHADTPVWLRKFFAWFFSIKGLPSHSTRMKELLQIGLNYQKLEEFTDLVHHIRELRGNLIRRMEEQGIELLLGPVMPFPSIEERVTNLFAMSVIYTFIWNVLDMPAGVVRFGTETGRLIDRSATEKDSYLEMVKKALPAAVGLPINVQVVGKPFEEEVVLRILCDLENVYEKQQERQRDEVMFSEVPKNTTAISTETPPSVNGQNGQYHSKANGNGLSRNGLISSATA